MKLQDLSIGIVLLLLISSCDNRVILKDSEGNRYHAKQYGDAFWMTENLKSTKDRSGVPAAYFFPDEDSANVSSFGLLYDFETACSICPDGWRLPTNEDWDNLFQLENKQSGAFKDSSYWLEGTNSNSTGFSARPAGYGNSGEHDNFFGEKSAFWSISKEDDHFVWTYLLEKGNDTVRMASQHPVYGFSVRCVKTQ